MPIDPFTIVAERAIARGEQPREAFYHIRRNILQGLSDQELQDYLSALEIVQKYYGVQQRLRTVGYKVPEALREELEERKTRSI